MINAVGRSLVAVFVAVAAGCASQSGHKTQDRAPTYQIPAESITDAIPRHDPVTRAGNKSPYTVLGQTYTVLPSSRGYRRAGIASWYGKKFHGRPTANGEIYNLYGMTAAHRTLPIPSYVKVTNLDNGRTAVVRINDRGPFHSDREIDLSYAAAVQLGYVNKGTAKVLVEAIDTAPPETVAAKPTGPVTDYFLQAGAFKSKASAENLQLRLSMNMDWPVKVQQPGPKGLYRVHIGPIGSMSDVQQVTDQLLAMNLGNPRLIAE